MLADFETPKYLYILTHISILMGYKNIVVSEDVYDKLAALKGEKSFNRLLDRLAESAEPKAKPLTDFLGAWDVDKEKASEIKNDLRKLWGTADARFRHGRND